MTDSQPIFCLYKIIEKRYIEDFVSGNFYFSCCGEWISKAKSSGGKGQGDQHEAIFAKYLRKNSRKPIKYYKKIFGKDLIVESEGEYVLLKRKSSLYIPAICFYNIDNQSIKQYLPDEEIEKIVSSIKNYENKDHVIVERLPIVLSQQYYDEFNIESDEIDAVLIQPRKVMNKLYEAGAICHKVTYINTDTEYDIFANKMYKKDYEIDMEKALYQHIEIFYKDKQNYEHQCEFRVALPQKILSGIKNGIKIHLSDLSHTSGVSNDGIPINATGKDFISNVKKQRAFATAHIHSSND